MGNNISTQLYVSYSIINAGRADALGASGIYGYTSKVPFLGDPTIDYTSVSFPLYREQYDVTEFNCCATAMINAISIFEKEITKIASLPTIDLLTFYSDNLQLVECLNKWTADLPDFGKDDSLELISEKNLALANNLYDRYTNLRLLMGPKLEVKYVESAVEPPKTWLEGHERWRNINTSKDLAKDNIDRQIIELGN